MKTALSLGIALMLIMVSCARITSPTGGEKDTSAPILLSSIPVDGQTLYKGNTIFLEFDEAVITKAIESKLIITPLIKGSFKVKVRRNTVLLILDSALHDNTTYTLNFGNTIQDINESNIPKNLYLSFATGKTIDSLTISGTVKNLYSSEPIEDALVSIYPITDSLDITTGPASYFTKTDSAGQYKFRNLPAGLFSIYSALDKNNNFKADTDRELYGFLLDTLNTTDNPNGHVILLQRLNTIPLSIKSARHFAHYFEVTYNKPITVYTVTASPKDSILHQQQGSDKIRFYNVNRSFTDSTRIIIYANDSINTNLKDTIQMYFRTTEVPYDKISLNLEPVSGSVLDTIKLKLEFNKPIALFNMDSVIVQKDTLTPLSLPKEAYWNESKTQVTWTLITNDYIQQNEKLNIRFKKGSFVSIEKDTANQEQKIFQMTKSEDSGLITGTINTSSQSFIVQLLSTQGLVIRESRNVRTYRFAGLDAGNYEVRLIIDNNNNGKFDIGNILTKTEPEEIIYFFDQTNKSKTVSVKRNWQVDQIDIQHTVNK